MKIQDLINEIFPEEKRIEENLMTTHEMLLSEAKDANLLLTEITDSIALFIKKISHGAYLTQAEVEASQKTIKEIKPDKLSDFMVGTFSQVVIKVYQKHEPKIAELIRGIENQIGSGKKLSYPVYDNSHNYYWLLNLFALTKGQVLPLRHWRIGFPGVGGYDVIFKYDIPFAINVLSITSQLPKNFQYCGKTIDKPLYPSTLSVLDSPKLVIKRGIKDSDIYFPYKRISKLYRGDTGDNTFVVTNGKKILFVRGVNDYSENGIIASKIATFISREHFSSERLLNNQLVGARKLPQYVISAADEQVRKKFAELLENKIVLPGTGIIDEVLNFVLEYDPNIENYGLSSTDLSQAFINKIDFDRCNIYYKLTKENYEQDILSNASYFPTVYKGAEYVKKDQNYIEEKLSARLKLALLTQTFLSALAKKAFTDPEKEAKAIEELANRIHVALDVFLSNSHSKNFLQNHPNILNEIYQQNLTYIKRHFDEHDSIEILNALHNRIAKVSQIINKLLDIQLNPVVEEKIEYKEEKSDPTNVQSKPVTLPYYVENAAKNAMLITYQYLSDNPRWSFFHSHQKLLEKLQLATMNLLDHTDPHSTEKFKAEFYACCAEIDAFKNGTLKRAFDSNLAIQQFLQNEKLNISNVKRSNAKKF